MSKDEIENKDTTTHLEVAQDNASSDPGEKEKALQPVYPLRDEDYVVTTKTWIVVTILASAYGVSTVLSQAAKHCKLTMSTTGILLDCPYNRRHLYSSRDRPRRPNRWRVVHITVYHV